MIVRDSIGQPLSEGDLVFLPLALGNFGQGQVVKIQQLATPENPNAPATVVVQFLTPLACQPNGVVGGLLKAPAAPQVAP